MEVSEKEWESKKSAYEAAVKKQAAEELAIRTQNKLERQARLGAWVEKHHDTIRYCLGHNGLQEKEGHPLRVAYEEMPQTPWLEDNELRMNQMEPKDRSQAV